MIAADATSSSPAPPGSRRRLLRLLKRGLRALLPLLLLLLAGWLLWRALRPVAYGVPAPTAGSRELRVEGRNFGRRPGRVLLTTRGPAPGYEITGWEEGRVTLALAEPLAGRAALQVRRRLLFWEWAAETVPVVVQAEGLPTDGYGYRVPLRAQAPWPLFRRDERNSGRSPLPARYNGDAAWSFATGKGIFSTPIVDADGTIYVGSADHNFYALNPGGTEKWRRETGEIVDSAGALPRVTAGEEPTVIFPSGDGYLYKVAAEDGALLWQFDARVSPRASYNNWWEGNVGIGYDGTLYAGNTNFNYYAVNPDGSLRWTYETGANNWSLGALAADGTIYWASNDTFVRAVRPDSPAGGPREQWTKRTLGFIAASAAVGSDGTVYIGSFDSYFYALDPETGATRWRFKTRDHIYSSAALAAYPNGETAAIYFGSTDGTLYALNPDGVLLWQYDTGDPIRSSPALGQLPLDDGGRDRSGGALPSGIVYVGSGNGRLYALDAASGVRRWSFDTSLDTPELRDRNDLNGSPALGESGVYIGGEHGHLWYVPYDYCLYQEDARCETDPGSDLPANTAGFFYVTPGGSTRFEGTPVVPAATMITLRLLLREGGATVDAWVCNLPAGCPADAVEVSARPAFPFTVEQAADGRYLYLRPEGFLQPDTTYTLTVRANSYRGGLNVGNWTLGGRRQGRVEDTLTFRTAPAERAALPLAVGADETGALEWTRLATPLPSMLPSLNQIGFDYMDWIMGTAALDEETGKFVLWAVGGRRDEAGTLAVDPATDFTLPLSGRSRADSFILTNRDFEMAITGIPIPFNLLEMRGQLEENGRVRPGATVWADTEALSIPTFGPYLVLAGLANNGWERLNVAGTYVTRPYEEGPANKRPAGVSLAELAYTAPTEEEDGALVATLALAPGAAYPAADHRPGLLLLDGAATEAVFLDYHGLLTHTADAAGNLETVTLRIPAGTALPDSLEAVVLLDVFPLALREVGSSE